MKILNLPMISHNCPRMSNFVDNREIAHESPKTQTPWYKNFKLTKADRKQTLVGFKPITGIVIGLNHRYFLRKPDPHLYLLIY